MQNKRHIALITYSIPNNFFGGGALTAYNIMYSFIRDGLKVSVITWPFFDRVKENEIAKGLMEKGVNIFYLSPVYKQCKNAFKFIKKIFFPDIKDIFPTYNNNDELRRLLDRIKPDALLIYHWEGLAASYKINTIPKVGLVGDPVYLPYLYRKEFDRVFSKDNFWQRLQRFYVDKKVRYQKLFIKELLSDCNISGAFAAHHAEMFREMGITCNYFRTPVSDPFINGARKIIISNKIKILLLGHLKGIATLSGINLFAEEIFPNLLKELCDEEFEIHIVGDFFDYLPDKLKEKLAHPCIKIRGHINPVDNEFLSSHLLLVPTPIELGVRVRIITAFSFGVPVVAHTANKKGIPEMEHNYNALLSGSGNGIVKEMIRLIKDKNLQLFLSNNGRKTYEKYFSLDTAGKEIIKVVEECINDKHKN